MLFEIIVFIIFIILISIQILHWCAYIYSRFSKNLEKHRQAIKFIAELAAKGKMKPRKKERDNDNTGYA